MNKFIKFSVLCLSLGACAPPSPPPDGAPSDAGRPVGTQIAVTVRGNVIYLPASFNGAIARPVPLDTGSPVTIVDPVVFSDAMISPGTSQTGSVGVGPLSFENVSIVGMSPCGATACPADTFTALVSGSVFSQTEVSLNYRDSNISLGEFELPELLAPEETSVDFKLEGGGLAAIPGVTGYVQLPATRIVVPVKLEGVDYTFIVDTGASLNVLGPDLFNKLVSDGRGHVGLKVLAIGGSVDVQATRIRRIEVGGVEVVGATALTGPFNLDALGQEVGHRVDGLLGGTFLREFLFKVRYPSRKLGLRRYTDRSFIADEFRRIGLTLKVVEGSAGHQFTTDVVFPGSDAAINPAVPLGFWGGKVLEIDGHSLDGLHSDDVDVLLRGRVGEHRTVKVLSAGNAVLSFSFLVQELLPLP